MTNSNDKAIQVISFNGKQLDGQSGKRSSWIEPEEEATKIYSWARPLFLQTVWQLAQLILQGKSKPESKSS